MEYKMNYLEVRLKCLELAAQTTGTTKDKVESARLMYEFIIKEENNDR